MRKFCAVFLAGCVLSGATGVLAQDDSTTYLFAEYYVCDQNRESFSDILTERHCHVNRVGAQRPAWIPFQAAALALSHTLNASFRNRLNVSLLHK